MWISLDFANALSVFGILLGLRGFEKYAGKKSSMIQNLIFLGSLVLVHAWFAYIKPDLTIRYLIIALATLVLFGQCAWLLLYRVPSGLKKLTLYTGIIFVLLFIVSGVKIADFLLGSSKPVDYFQSGALEGIVMITYQMLVIALTASISVMLNNNLMIDIKTEEAKFSTTFHTAPNAIVLTRYPEGTIIEANNVFYEITGHNPEEVSGKTILEIGIWRNDSDRQEVMAELMKSGQVNRLEYQFRKKDGEMLSCLLSAKIISMGNENCLITSIYDITERKSFQEVISHERNLLRTLIDHLPDPVTIKDSKGRYLLNNKAHLDIIGASEQEETLGKTAFDFFPEDYASIYDADDRNVLQTGKMILDKIEQAEHAETGFPYWHSTSKIPIRDKKGVPIQILTISHDITERKRAEDALRESDEFNRSLLKTIPFGMDVVDETGTILFVGENFRKIFGGEVVGRKCWEVYRDDKEQCQSCPLNRGIMMGTTEIYESHGIMGGKIFDIYHTGMMFHGKKAMLEIFHDVTERKKNEIDLIKSKERAEESDKLKTAFLHNISHEIRTPMNAIVGFANLLQEPGISKEEMNSYLETISRSSNHLLSIVNDVIEIANVEAGVLRCNSKNIDLNNILEDLLQQFRAKSQDKGIELKLERPEAAPVEHLNTDGTKLMQVLTNLLNNAFKFTNSGSIVYGYLVKKNHLEFFVSDTGIGIEYDQQSRIFERFYQIDNTVTRMHEGTGIGLSISKAYVELLGGKIWLKSELGKGSTFYFTIPYKG
jgi:PAS domain S-box-containing protein